MNTINLKLYDFAKQEFKLSDAKAREFVTILDEAVLDDIKANSNEYKSIVREDFLKVELKIEQVRKEISDSKTDIIKWVAAFIIGQTALLVTLINF